MTYDPYQDPSSQESIRKGWLDKFSGSQNVTLGPGSIPLPGESPMSSDKMSPPSGYFRRPAPMPPSGGGLVLRGPGFSADMPSRGGPIGAIGRATPNRGGIFGGMMPGQMDDEELRRRMLIMRAMGGPGGRGGGLFGNMPGMISGQPRQMPAIPRSFFGNML